MGNYFGILLLSVILVNGVRYINHLFDEKPRSGKLVSHNDEACHSLFMRYRKVLGIDNIPINSEIVNKAFHKQLELATDDRICGFKPTYSFYELRAAKVYLVDFCGYIGNWN